MSVKFSLVAALLLGPFSGVAQQNIRDLHPGSAARFTGGATNDLAGSAVSVRGDFNGDGIEDIALSAPNADANGLTNSGEVYLFFGNRGGRGDLSIDALRNGDGSQGVVIAGDTANSLLGRGLGSANINGDHIDDLVIGAPLHPGAVGGVVYVLFGRSQDFAPTFNVGQLATADGSQTGLGTVFLGAQLGGAAGVSVTGLDDINGDGFGDLLIGNNQSFAGFTTRKTHNYLIYGRGSTQAWPSVINMVQTRTGLEGGSLGVLVLSAESVDAGGTSVADAADLTGDGFGDGLFGAPDAQGGRGAVHVLGSTSEYNGDVDLANTINDPFSHGRIDGATDDLRFGEAIARIGDFNGDGREDYVVGSPTSADESGRVYVLFGPSPGSWRGVRSVSDMVASGNALRIVGSGGERLGASVAAAGDVNGDGLRDVLVGAQNSATTSRAYVFFGRAQGGQINATENGFVYHGNSGDDSTGRAVDGGGDFDADGSSDLLIAAPFDDLSASNSGTAYLVFGTAEDATPRLSGSLSHAWYDPELPGQGVLTEFGTLDGEPALFATWYTFENGKPRWLVTNLENFDPATRSVESEAFVTSGGGFGDAFNADNVTISSWGRIRATLTDCDRLLWEYERADGAKGTLRLTPVLADLLNQKTCTVDDKGAQATASRQARGLIGTLWNPARGGEGVVIDIEHRGDQPTLFFSWFTYGQGGNQVWLVGSGPIDLATGTAAGLTLFQARGTGFGDAFDPAAVQLLEWGTADLIMPDCASATLRYDGAFPGGAAFHGEIELVRFTEGLNGFGCR